MANNLGKNWEEKFKSDWKKSFPNTFFFRLRDNLNGFKESSQNPVDFICFTGEKLFLVECKEHKGASIPFSAIPQYERMLTYKNCPNVFPGVLVWFSEKDLVIWVSIEEMEKMVLAGEKSIGVRMLNDNIYDIKVLPAVKKRVFMEVDYTVFNQFIK